MFSFEQSYPGLGDPRLQSSKDSVLQTRWMIFSNCLTSVVSYIRLHGLCDWIHILSINTVKYERQITCTLFEQELILCPVL